MAFRRVVEGPDRQVDALPLFCSRLAEASSKVRGKDTATATANLKTLVLSDVLPPDVFPWRRLATPDGVWLMTATGSSWGPGRRPMDAHGSLYVTLIRERAAPRP